MMFTSLDIADTLLLKQLISLSPFADDNSLEVPPDPFPNSEVKLQCANGSVVRPCESRSSSAPYSKYPLYSFKGGVFCIVVSQDVLYRVLSET